jgi:Dehydrogenases with different specificities (related to short-chain alcohol dehydrogenases)
MRYDSGMEKLFYGKKAVVVGGSGGIGRAIADGLFEAGASVNIVGRHVSPGNGSFVLDLERTESHEAVIALVQDADILCVVRGPFLQKPLHETVPEEWTSIVYSNLTFPGILVSSALSHMCSSGWGRILLFGGTRTDSVRGFRTNAAYAAAKTGISSLVRSVAMEYAASGITCNAICPGFVDTDYLDAQTKRALALKNPDEKLISVKEIADLALLLLGNNVYNGVVMPADKGWTPAFI